MILKMKKILFVLSIFCVSIIFSQNEKQAPIISDFKIGVYDNNSELIDTLGIFISKQHSKKEYDLCIDVAVNKRKNAYGGVGIAIESTRIDQFFRNLTIAHKEFQNYSDKRRKSGNRRIGDQIPVQIYQWDSKDINGPSNRIDKEANKKSYPLSIEFIKTEDKTELWIYTNGKTSNPKEVAIVFNSLENLTQFLKLTNPGFLKQSHQNQLKQRGK
tara:strand:+ start:1289 stop:1933 length:645 start_codon:yes stop_codon:yes gene_type:complete